MSALARGAVAVALVLVATGTGRASSSGDGNAPPVGGSADGGAVDGSHSRGPRPGYDCSKGGFCGTEGWAYGSYATDTKESTGCGVGEDGVDLWDLSASHSPTLPEFARPYCAFFYGFKTCSVPTVVCEN